MPHYAVPAAVPGKTAVDRRYQRHGAGEMLLLDAICRVVRASSTIAVYAVIVDAKNEGGRTLCEGYGFRVFASVPRGLFLPLQTFRMLKQ